ncbi:MAG: hypothetical protein GY753_18725 [Gammaproteobacteria bacterium]|nr:hypothetical protein [Gammaproteobacteria bacterium]
MLVETAKNILLAVGLEPIALENGLFIYVSPPDKPMPLHLVASYESDITQDLGGKRINMEEWSTFKDEWTRGYHQ